MKEIKVAENKTLKLTNVLSREIHPEEMASLPVVLTQMHNFIKSNNAQPIGPIVQAMVVGEDRQMHLYMMQQATPAPCPTASWLPTSCRSTLLRMSRN